MLKNSILLHVANSATFSTNLKRKTVKDPLLDSVLDTSINIRPHELYSPFWHNVYSLVGWELPKTSIELKAEAFLEGQRKKQSHKKLGATMDVNQNAYEGNMYVGEIVMGTAQTAIDVIYDTGSDWLCIPDSSCSSCEGTKHDNSGATVVSAATEERLYGSAALSGSTYSDKVCLSASDSSTCISTFEYFAITDQQGLSDPIEGILGLCAGADTSLLCDGCFFDPGPLLIEGFSDEGSISANQFSFALYGFNSDTQSVLDIGEPDSSKYAGENLVQIYLEQDFFWLTRWMGVNLNANSDEHEYQVDDLPYTILDSGSSHLFVPRSAFYSMFYEMLRQAGRPEFVVLGGLAFVECDADWQPIQIMLQNNND